MSRKISFEIPSDPPAVAPTAAPAKAPALSGMAGSLQKAAADTQANRRRLEEVETALADARAMGVVELAPDLIDQSEFSDRFSHDDPELAGLTASLAQFGQRVPILVTAKPDGRYQIVYGRRRLEAMRQLGRPVQALIRHLDPVEALRAQGQENTYRRDLSWIEKAVFALTLAQHGKDSDFIRSTLNVDISGLSRMDTVTRSLRQWTGTDAALRSFLMKIGPAPTIGRDRWYSIAQLLDKVTFPAGNPEVIAGAIHAAAHTSSDDRFLLFQRLIEQAMPKVTKRLSAGPVTVALSGKHHATVKAGAAGVAITIPSKGDPALTEWISKNPEAAIAALRKAAEGDGDL